MYYFLVTVFANADPVQFVGLCLGLLLLGVVILLSLFGCACLINWFKNRERE